MLPPSHRELLLALHSEDASGSYSAEMEDEMKLYKELCAGILAAVVTMLAALGLVTLVRALVEAMG